MTHYRRNSSGQFAKAEQKKGNFRFFQDYSDDAVDERIERDPGFSFFTRGLIIKSLKSFNFLDSKGKPENDNKAIREKILPFIDEFWNAIQSDLSLAYGALTATKGAVSTDENAEPTLVFDGFWKNQITYKHNKMGVMSLVTTEKAIKYPEETKDGTEQVTSRKQSFENDELKNVKFIGSIPGKDIGDYVPWVGVIWDDLFGWNIISGSAVVFTIRNGAGQWIGYAPADFIKNNEETITAELRGSNSEDTIIMWPLMTDDLGNKIELQQMSSEQIDFLPPKEIILGRLSMYTGVPKSRIEGITQGQQAGEVFIDKELSEAKQMNQDKFRHIFEWAGRVTVEIFPTLTWDEKGTVDFEKREELSTRGAAEVLSLELKNFEVLRKYMTLEEAAGQAGLDFEDIDLTEPEPLDLTGDGKDPKDPNDNDDGNGVPSSGQEDLLNETPIVK